MKIARITLRHVRIPFRHAFSTSRWTLTHKDAILVEAATDDGLTGWGECVALAYPDYCYESTAINALVLREYADMSYAEIAEAQGVGIQTVKSRLNRARRAVQTLLQDT